MSNYTASLRERRQGMAITSLVLGILSLMCLGPLTALPAVILGHIAYSRSKNAPHQYQGGGLAIAGLTMGYVGLLATAAILAGMLLPALAKAKAKAQSIKCVNQMKNVGLAFRIFSVEHGDQFPFNAVADGSGARIEAMDKVQIFRAVARELPNPSHLVCPADSKKHPAASVANLTAANISYEVETGPEVKESNPRHVLARCPIHGHELLCDGSVHQGRRR
jgi:hypothetical protein